MFLLLLHLRGLPLQTQPDSIHPIVYLWAAGRKCQYAEFNDEGNDQDLRIPSSGMGVTSTTSAALGFSPCDLSSFMKGKVRTSLIE
jgi:hypothetical protein